MAARTPVSSPWVKLNGQRWGLPFKRLTQAEFKDHHDKGIWYRCDEKNFIGHRCKNKQLQILLVEEEDTERGPEPDEWEQDQLALNDAAGLSLNSVVGISTPKTMKLQVRVDSQEVVVLIDCGASLNFISMDLVDKLGMPSVGTHCFGVLMGTGLSIKGVGLCQGVEL